MKILIYLIFFFMMVVCSTAQSKICKYKGRQMTPGQKNIDCFTKATCMENGKIKKEQSCPRYFCLPKSKTTGYKRFNPKESFPSCCGGEVCEEKYKNYW